MRKLMWFSIGFAGGCGVCAYVLERAWLLPAFLVGVVLCLGVYAVSGKNRITRAVSMALFGVMVSLGWFLLFFHGYLRYAVELDGTEQNVIITVTDHSWDSNYGVGFDGRLEIRGRSYQVRGYYNEQEALTPGDQLRGTFRFSVTTGDGMEEATNDPGKGVFLRAYPRGDIALIRCREDSFCTLPSRIRFQIKTIITDVFPEDTDPFAKALLLGDTEDLSYEVDADLKISGIRHIAAVSGLHISILFALISTMTLRKRYLTALFGIPVLCVFAAIAGFTPSVVRACIMSGIMILSSVFDREYDGPTALSFSVLVMLAVNPLAVTSASLQLSVASVAGIFCFREPMEGWIVGRFGKKLEKVKLVQRFAASVAITFSSMVFTTPLCAYYFGVVSLIAPVTNLLTLWIISFVFYGIMAAVGLGLVWQTGAAMAEKVILFPIRYVLLTAKTMAGLPISAVYTESIFVVIWLVLCYVLLILFYLQKRRRPAELICCACLGLCLALLAGWAEPITDDVRMTVLDVGQGQAILLQSEGRTYLVDCGGDSDTKTADLISGTLLSQGIDQLDGIILSHYDRDHAGALENLLTRIPTQLLLLPDTVNARGFSGDVRKTLYVTDPVELSVGDSKITVFGPIYDGDDNENSMCVLFERENCAILITGDRSAFGERMLMRKTELPDVDVLIAGHHGSKYSTSEELLRQVKPETVIISVGEDNSYGHPAPELLERLDRFGCTVYRTDLHGTILFRR